MMAWPTPQGTTLEEAHLALQACMRGEVQLNADLGAQTTWKVGGPADLLLSPADEKDLAAALQVLAEFGVSWVVLGKGSNTLVADAGYRGAVIRLETGFEEIHHQENALGDGRHLLVAGGGASINALLRYVVVHRLAGVEMLTGIPGTVGGTVRMNGGTHLGEFSDALHGVRLMEGDGTVVEHPAERFAFGYRSSAIQSDQIVCEAHIAVKTAVDDSFARTIREVKERRRETQPLTQPSGGSTFANPEGDKAWRLLEAAGLRGEVEGGARYSEVHANFIVNDGEATATDIEALIRRGKERVEGISGIVLREEVCRLDPEGWAHDKEGE